MIAPRDRQDGPASLHSAPREPQKSPKPRLELGRRTLSRVYLPIWELPSGSDRLHTASAESGDMEWACWDAYQVAISQAGPRAFNRSFMDSSNQPASPPCRQPAHDRPCPLFINPSTPSTRHANAPTVKLFRLSAS